MPASRFQVLLAEAIGTFALIFIGVLVVSASPLAGLPEGQPGLTSVAFAHGLTIAVMIAAMGAISGGHFNPAVTMGFMATGRMSVGTGLSYWLAQLVGAALAGFLLVSLVGRGGVANGTPALAQGVSPGVGIVLELVANFFLVLVVFGTAVDERAPKSVFPFAIGLTVTLGMLGIAPLTGGAVNPARAFGPALASGNWTHQLVYWIGGLLGGALGGLIPHYLLAARAPAPPTGRRGGPAPSEERP